MQIQRQLQSMRDAGSFNFPVFRAFRSFLGTSIQKMLRSIVIIQVVIFTLFFMLSLVVQIYQQYRQYEQESYQTAALIAQDIVGNLQISTEITKFPITVHHDKQSFVFSGLQSGRSSSNLQYCQALYDVLKPYLNQNRFIDNICIYDMNGDGVYVKQDQNTYFFSHMNMDTPWVVETLANKGGQTFVKEQDFVSTGLAKPAFCVSRAIINGYTLKPVGIMTIAIPSGDLDRSYDAIKRYPEQQYALLYQNDWLLGEFANGIDTDVIQTLSVRQPVTRNVREGGSLYMYNYYRYNRDWTLVVRTPTTTFTQGLVSINIPFFLAIALFLSLVTVAINHIVQSVLRPLHILVDTCNSMEGTSFPAAPEENLPLELKTLFSSFNAMSNRVDMLVNEVLIKDLAHRETELQLLRTQINPHYLYNTLECMHMRAYSNRDYDVSRMAELLGRNLQYGLRNTTQEVSLHTELDQAREYITLISYHYGDSIHFSSHMSDDILYCQTIKLILQPIIENAVMHGYPEGRALNIEIMGYRVENAIEITISDDGAGIRPERLEQIQEWLRQTSYNDSRIGLLNVHRRLRLYYGEGYGVELSSVHGRGTVNKLRLPYLPRREEVVRQ